MGSKPDEKINWVIDLKLLGLTLLALASYWLMSRALSWDGTFAVALVGFLGGLDILIIVAALKLFRAKRKEWGGWWPRT